MGVSQLCLHVSCKSVRLSIVVGSNVASGRVRASVRCDDCPSGLRDTVSVGLLQEIGHSAVAIEPECIPPPRTEAG